MIQCENFVQGEVGGLKLLMKDRTNEKILEVAGVNIPSKQVSSSKSFQNVQLKIVKRKLIFTDSNDGSKTFINLCRDPKHSLCDYRRKNCTSCKNSEILCLHCEPTDKECQLIPNCRHLKQCYDCLTKDDPFFPWAVKKMLFLGHSAEKQREKGSALSLLPLDILKEIFAFVEKSPRKYVDSLCRKTRFFCDDVKCNAAYSYPEKTLDLNSRLNGLLEVQLNLNEKCKCCMTECKNEIKHLCLTIADQERRDAYGLSKGHVYGLTKRQKTEL